MRIRTRSPGKLSGTNTTRPSIRPTPAPAWLRPVISNSCSAPACQRDIKFLSFEKTENASVFGLRLAPFYPKHRKVFHFGGRDAYHVVGMGFFQAFPRFRIHHLLQAQLEVRGLGLHNLQLRA